MVLIISSLVSFNLNGANQSTYIRVTENKLGGNALKDEWEERKSVKWSTTVMFKTEVKAEVKSNARVTEFIAPSGVDERIRALPEGRLHNLSSKTRIILKGTASYLMVLIISSLVSFNLNGANFNTSQFLG
jgi:hypothetical protein